MCETDTYNSDNFFFFIEGGSNGLSNALTSNPVPVPSYDNVRVLVVISNVAL